MAKSPESQPDAKNNTNFLTMYLLGCYKPQPVAFKPPIA